LFPGPFWLPFFSVFTCPVRPATDELPGLENSACPVRLQGNPGPFTLVKSGFLIIESFSQHPGICMSRHPLHISSSTSSLLLYLDPLAFPFLLPSPIDNLSTNLPFYQSLPFLLSIKSPLVEVRTRCISNRVGCPPFSLETNQPLMVFGLRPGAAVFPSLHLFLSDLCSYGGNAS